MIKEHQKDYYVFPIKNLYLMNNLLKEYEARSLEYYLSEKAKGDKEKEYKEFINKNL
jgi:hypothetical protein